MKSYEIVNFLRCVCNFKTNISFVHFHTRLLMFRHQVYNTTFLKILSILSHCVSLMVLCFVKSILMWGVWVSYKDYRYSWFLSNTIKLFLCIGTTWKFKALMSNYKIKDEDIGKLALYFKIQRIIYLLKNFLVRLSRISFLKCLIWGD